MQTNKHNIIVVDNRTGQTRIVAVPEEFEGVSGPYLLWRLRRVHPGMIGMTDEEQLLASELESSLAVEDCRLIVDYYDLHGSRDVSVMFDPREGTRVLGFYSDRTILLRGRTPGVNDGHAITLAAWCGWPKEAGPVGTARLAEKILDWMDRYGRGRAPLGDSPLTPNSLRIC